jgi:hypothetical protein
MNTYKISIPNDYESEADSEAAMQDCYREEIEAAVVRLEARAYSDPANADCCMLPLDEECDGKALLKALESRWKAGLPAAFSSDEVIAEARDGLDQAARQSTLFVKTLVQRLRSKMMGPCMSPAKKAPQKKLKK